MCQAKKRVELAVMDEDFSELESFEAFTSGEIGPPLIEGDPYDAPLLELPSFDQEEESLQLVTVADLRLILRSLQAIGRVSPRAVALSSRVREEAA